MRRPHPSYLLALVAASLAGCGWMTFQPPPIVDSRTALENQVLGSQEPLSKDLLLAASLPAVAREAWEEARQAPAGSVEDRARRADAQERLVHAIQSQEYNRDDLLQARRSGWVGEAASGEVHLFEERMAPIEVRARERLRALVAEENRDREDLLDAVLQLSAALSASDRPELQKVFAKQYQEQLVPGDWIEDRPGHWMQVGGHVETAR